MNEHLSNATGYLSKETHEMKVLGFLFKSMLMAVIGIL